jgi:hypothetical protein
MKAVVQQASEGHSGRRAAGPRGRRSLSEHAAYRAARQAVAALLHGAPISNIDIDGAEIEWPDLPVGKRSPRDVVAPARDRCWYAGREVRSNFRLENRCHAHGAQRRAASEIFSVRASVSPFSASRLYHRSAVRANEAIADDWFLIEGYTIAVPCAPSDTTSFAAPPAERGRETMRSLGRRVR